MVRSSYEIKVDVAIIAYDRAMKTLGIDFGTKHVGLALSDIEGKVAFPKKTLNWHQGIVDDIKQFADDEEVEQIVLGIPSNVPESWREKIMLFKTALEGEAFHVELQDESFSSHEAHQTAHGLGLKLTDTDASAAALILQRYLDKQQ